MSDNFDLIDEQARRQFESDWKAKQLKEFESYLPDPTDSKYWPTLEELLYIDLEFSWKEFEKLPSDETVSIDRSPTTRLKQLSKRLKLENRQDLLERLEEFDRSLKDKSKNRKPSAKKQQPPDESGFEFETVAFGAFDTTSADANPQLNVQSNQDFGDFVLHEMLGRGGMGVVFKATEKKTGRKVALKMIRSNIVNRIDEETQRIVMDRFATEAKAVAGIEHPNIVTLYQVGQHEETPFISMQLVNGDDLASRIRQAVFDGKTAAQIIRKVALAIHASHENGIIHRDLKPHNVLLSDESNEPLVTDFGLAKLTDNANGVTETGELLGTPGYMSPEQASGQTVNHSTDIYSLGATLYCLIGGRAPFQAADTMKTIEQIVKNPPIAPNEVNPDVELDLNTICLKCLEKDPVRRYDSAKALADDLDRYLKGEPIQARPVSRLNRSIRWCKRNPLPTTIIVSMILLVAVALTGFVLSERYRSLSQANANLAFKSNQTELFRITEDQTLKLPGMNDTRRNLIEPLREFFEAFIELNGELDYVKQEFAFAHFALGKIDYEYRNYDLAEEHLEKAITLQKEILDLTPEDLDGTIRFDLSNSLNLLGTTHLKRNERGKAFEKYDAAHQIRKELVMDFPKKLEFKRKLANSEMNLGNWFGYKEDKESNRTALAHYKTSNAIRSEVLGDDTTNETIRFHSKYDFAKNLFNMAVSHISLEENDKSLESANAALDLLSKLHVQKPLNLFVSRDQARCAQLLLELDTESDPSFYLSEIARAYRHITKLYPDETQYHWLAARALISMGDFAAQELGANMTKKESRLLAKESFEMAFAHIEELPPQSADEKMTVVNVCLGLVPIFIQDTKNAAAKAKLELARSVLESFAEGSHPDLELQMGRLKAMESILSSLLAPEL